MFLSRGDRLRAAAPAALLVVVAAVGAWRSATLDQSSWQGASFGMFATYDNDVSRYVAVTLVGTEGAVRASLPVDLRDDAKRLQVVPTRTRADALAEAVLPRVDDRSVRSVEVQVLRIVLTHQDGLRIHVAPLVAGSATR